VKTRASAPASDLARIQVGAQSARRPSGRRDDQTFATLLATGQGEPRTAKEAGPSHLHGDAAPIARSTPSAEAPSREPSERESGPRRRREPRAAGATPTEPSGRPASPSSPPAGNAPEHATPIAGPAPQPSPRPQRRLDGQSHARRLDGAGLRGSDAPPAGRAPQRAAPKQPLPRPPQVTAARFAPAHASVGAPAPLRELGASHGSGDRSSARSRAEPPSTPGSASADPRSTATAATPMAPQPVSGPAAAERSAGAPTASSVAAPDAALPELPPGVVDGAVLPGAAHLRLSGDGMGEVSLHLRLRDGIAHVRVEADSAGLLRDRAPELSRALAAEGLTLGRLEVDPPPPLGAAPGGAADDGTNSRRQREQDGCEGDAPPRSAPRGASRPARNRPARPGKIDVEA